MKRLAVVIVSSLGVLAALLTLVLVFGGPRSLPPMASINDPFRDVDFSGLPPLTPYTARDGARLVFRAYASRTDPAKGSVVLIHGSSARSNSLHPWRRVLPRRATRPTHWMCGDTASLGQRARLPTSASLRMTWKIFCERSSRPAKGLLLGFSAGGGFALRFAASDRQNMFDRYLLLAPFLHQDAPTSRPTAGDWVATGIPRIIGLTFLNRLGLTQLNSLPVLAFALGAEARQFLTPTYSYALAMNFRPHNNYRADIVAAERPLQVLVGEDDELFYAEQFSAVFQAAGKPATVQTLPGVDHIGLTLKPAAIQAVIAAAEQF